MKPTFVTFIGGWGGAHVEQIMASAHRAITRDILDRAKACQAFQRMVIVTDSPESFSNFGEDIFIEPAQNPFHFGRNLRDVVYKYQMERVFYIGGGGMPLLHISEMAQIARQLLAAQETVISNNPYSADLVAFTPADAMDRIPLPANDNVLPKLLYGEAGLESVTLPRSIATLLDVDTPIDLAILSLHSSIGPHLRTYLDTLDLGQGRLLRAARLLTDPQAEILVAGRVSSYVWSRLERETACRCRIISEERGMRADGREQTGKVRSILGQYMETARPQDFFRRLAQLGDAAFLDTRVLFHHLGLKAAPSDKFLSDLMSPGQIGNTWLREFTQAALDAPIPVILGGHSLVSGGLLALIEIAWANTTLIDRE